MNKRKIKNKNGASSCGTKINEAVDFFSSLPDNVFANIFSFLTMKEAFYTCVSCRELKHLMTSITNVEFKETSNGCLTKKREFVQSVSRFLGNHDSLVQKFQLSFCPASGYRSDVLHWLSLVVKNGIEELDLIFDDKNYLEIPVSLLTAGTLKVLKLKHCIVDLPSITGFKSLKSLLLGSMYISNSVMSLLCCHCESLQCLTLENCSGFTDIEIIDPRSKLETLVLDGCCLNFYFLINILSLKTLSIRLSTMSFFLNGCPHIDDLILYRETELPITQEESAIMKDNIVDSLGNVRSLHLGGWAFECFVASRPLVNHQLTNLEVLDLDFNACLKNQKELTNLITHAKGLKTLFISIKQNYYAGDDTINTACNFETVSAYFWDNKYEAKRTVGLKNNIGVSNNTLLNIDFKDFTGNIHEVSFIKLMLAHFPHLRVIKVTPFKGMDEDQSRAYAKLFSRFPRVSTDVYMLVGSEEVWKDEQA